MADRERAVTACTVVARNYLPAARVLARSYLRHHPGNQFVIALIDADHGLGEHEDGYRVVGKAEFGIDEATYLRMATAYSVTELATAVKPYLLRELRAHADVVIYLDPDITVFAPMPELAELAREHGIVLTPHFLEPLPRDGKEPTEAQIMGAGIFNLGFVATGPGSEPFLDFWAQRLRQDAIVAPQQQLFTDQRWVDQVPALFRHHVLRDPGFNVAYWNAHERDLRASEDGSVTAAGKPLRFFHFSGYRPEKPWLLTNHTAQRPRVMLSQYPAIRALCDTYGAALKAAGYAETLDAVPYGYAELDDGTKLTQAMRRLFRSAWVRAERKDKPLPPAGFGPDGGQALRDWFAGPAEDIPAGSGLNRLTMAVWDARPDLQTAFPQPYGAHAPAFRAWCRSSGAVEERLADWALPEEPAELTEPQDALGVNVLGYLTAELGVGEMGRIVLDAITKADVPVAAVVEDRLVSNRTGLDHPETLGTPRFPVSLLAVNADQTAPVLASHPEVGHHRYRIGLWAWELAEFPEELHTAFDLVDEVWTISEFCRESIAAHTTLPVKTIPVPVRDPGPPHRERTDDAPTRFLFAFDFYSIPDRKNPWGLVRAFQQAFPDRDDVRLTIKAINGNKHPDKAEQLRVLVADDPRVDLVERYLSVAELHELYDTSDAYVSLHRSEGFGLTVAEAMVRGLPVISTDYSGTAEFLDERTGWPIPYKLVEVGKKQGPYPEDAVWADPDLDAAATAMRAVADDRDEAARRGRAAREHILSTRSFSLAAQWMRTELTAAHQAWRAGKAAAGADPATADPLRPLRDSRQALLWRPEVGSASRLPLAPALRKAVLRAIDHYDVHQRKVMGTLADGMEGTAATLAARLDALEQQLAQQRATSERLTEQLESSHDAVPALVESVDALRDDVTGLRDVDTATAADLHKVSGRVDKTARQTHDMFVERDRRFDEDQRRILDLTRDVDAVHHAARLRHAPVPDGADVVLCDAGALLAPDDDVVLPWLRYHRSWERGEADLMARLVSEGTDGTTFVDVGAHVGYHTLRLLQSGTGVGRVVAIEANPTNAEFLRRNVEANLNQAGADTVTVLPVAAWDSKGEIRLVQAEAGNSGDHRANPVDAGSDGVVVPAVRLDQVPEITEHKVGLVKVDLQGRDHRALAGLADVLDRDHPHVVCEFCPEAIEELGDDPGEVLAGYGKLGYRAVLVTEDGPVDGEHTEEELIAAARAADSGFVTVWLQPT